jgi:hypothetical protein
MHVVYDLHRFDLLDALHYPLPEDSASEEELFAEVSEEFGGLRRRRRSYGHARAGDDDQAGP